MNPKKPEILSGQDTLKNIGYLGLFTIISIILILTFTACSISNKTAFTQKDNNASVNFKTGERFQVRLESNQTTGYGWKLSEKTDIGIITTISSTYETSSNDKDIAGAGGFETFTFQAVKPGQTKLILEYVRSWEEEVEPVETYTLEITVR